MIENVFPEALLADVQAALAADASATFAIVGHSPAAYDLLRLFHSTGQSRRLIGIFDATIVSGDVVAGLQPLEALRGQGPTYVAIAVDEGKWSAPLFTGQPGWG